MLRAGSEQKKRGLWMWLILGTAAIVSALINVVFTFTGREAKYYRFASLSLTALTLCALFGEAVLMLKKGDISGMQDVLPTMYNVLWLLAIASVLINSISLFCNRSK